MTNISTTVHTYGHSIKIGITGLFISTLDESAAIIQHGKLIQPISGNIINGCLLHGNNIFEQHNVSNIKLTFIKNNVSNEMNDNYIDSPNNIIYDYTYTNKLGEYYAFLESGEYRVRIDTPNKQFFFNQVIPTGIQEYYLYPESAYIKEKIDDTTILYGTSKVLVAGCLLNEHNTPFPGEICISQGNQLITFIKTQTGKYNFLIDYGIYDIRIRHYHRSVKIYQKFNFQPGKGFFTELDKNYISRNDTHIDKYLNINLPPKKNNQYTF